MKIRRNNYPTLNTSISQRKEYSQSNLRFSFSTNPSTTSLYAKGRVLGFKRAKRNQRPDISLVQIEGVKTAADTEFYLGKRIAFVYRAKREVNGSKIRCIWGRITRAHGGSGAVKARFRNNLPAKSFGASVRVMMYPSRV
ncbi:60S ribosomal protein L33A [Podila epicladia]|nr:60S ribosomal protein L33A [Podila epicladia]